MGLMYIFFELCIVSECLGLFYHLPHLLINGKTLKSSLKMISLSCQKELFPVDKT